jgi:protein ImuB
MRRVVSVWLPTWPTDRLRRHGIGSPDSPLITSLHDGRRRTVAASDQAAIGLGLQVGMKLTQAQALVPGLSVVEADQEGDATALAEAAAWCLRYAPTTAPDPPDGLWIDATGCTHLFGGEQRMLEDLRGRFRQTGVEARAAIADTPGAAWAVARHGGSAATIVPRGDCAASLAELPVAGLRLPEDTQQALRRLGFERIGQLAAAPRGPLALRFGDGVLRRLDQALGRVFEPLTPICPPTVTSHRLVFVEPILTQEAFAEAIRSLAGSVCEALERQGQGARQLDLLFERVDGSLQAIRVGTARPARAPKHLARLLEDRLEAVDPGLGVEAMRLVVPLAERLGYVQPTGGLPAGGLVAAEATCDDIAPLVDRLTNRLGAGRVYRAEPVESDVPERSVRTVPPLTPPRREPPLREPALRATPHRATPHRATSRQATWWWPTTLPRPVRLLDPPQRVQAMALLPDQPPVQFVWRGLRHRVRRSDGPERVFGEWWRRSSEVWAVRDYFAVEDEHGARFWLFRQGDGVDPATGDLGWFLHGLF